MNFLTLLSLAIALSMDAFSVSICKGLTTKEFSIKTAISCGLWFGFFQALMPVIGYFLGIQFESLITSIDHWIAFGLLFLIGANMIREAFGDEDDKNSSKKMFFTFGYATDLSCSSEVNDKAYANGVSEITDSLGFFTFVFFRYHFFA